MTVSGPYEHSLSYTGLSTDTKPTERTNVGTKFYETDSGKTFVYTGSTWAEFEPEE